jgi:hypothetical protein
MKIYKRVFTQFDTYWHLNIKLNKLVSNAGWLVVHRRKTKQQLVSFASCKFFLNYIFYQTSYGYRIQYQ